MTIIGSSRHSKMPSMQNPVIKLVTDGVFVDFAAHFIARRATESRGFVPFCK